MKRFVLALLTLGTIAIPYAIGQDHVNSSSNQIDLWLKVLAILGTTLFFLYKAISGSLAASTSTGLEVTPVTVSGQATGLVSLVLERGENYSVRIESILIRVEMSGGKHQEFEVPFKDRGRKSYYLGPRERTQYGWQYR